MLNLVRKHADSWMIKSILWLIVFAFIGTIFYSWGMGGATGTRGGVVATVEGTPINYSEYDRTFNNLINFYRDQFRDQFSEDLVQKLDLKSQALDALIQKKLLLREAEKQNIRVSDAELIERIRGFAAFQKDNRFDPAVYQRYLQFQRLTTMEFEESQREALSLEKIENLIKANTKVTEREINEAFKQQNEKIKLDYIVFFDDRFEDNSPITEEELKNYFEKNKDRFEVSEQIKVDYIKLEPKSYESKIEIRDEDIKNYYDSKLADFTVKKQFKASHILFTLKPPENAIEKTEEEKQKASDEAAKSKANEVLKKIGEGADFAEMAKKHSDDKTSGANGGSLGEFSTGTMVTEFEAELQKLKMGEISEPVLSPFGYHIIRLEGKSDERIKPESEVQEEISRKLKEIKSRQRVRRIIKRIHKSAEKASDLAAIAAKHNATVNRSEFFSRENHNLPEIGMAPEFFNQAFALNDNELSAPINTFEASYLLIVVGRIPPYIPELSEIRDKVTKAVALEKKRTAAANKFAELKTKLGMEKDLESIAKELEMEVRHTPFFGWDDSLPGIGNIKSIKEAVFKLDPGQTTAEKFRKRHFLIKVNSREAAGYPSEEQIKPIVDRLKTKKGTVVFNYWLKNLREKADIMIDKTLM